MSVMQEKLATLAELGKPVIILDIDGPLTQYYEALALESESRWGKVLTIHEDHTKIWGVSHSEGLQRLQQLRADGFYRKLPHTLGAIEAVHSLSRTFTIITATSRPIDLQHVTEAWLLEHLGSSISLNIHAGIFDNRSATYEQQLRTTKAGLISNLLAQGLAIQWFVDDEPKHIIGVSSETPVPTIHFAKPYHSPAAIAALPANVQSLNSWQHIHAYIQANQQIQHSSTELQTA